MRRSGTSPSALKREYPERERLLVELALAQNEAGHPEQALTSLEGITPSGRRGPLGAILCGDRVCARQVESAGVRRRRRFVRRCASIARNAHYWEFLIGLLLKNDEAPLALAEAIRAQQKFPDNADIQFLFALASYHVTESPLSKLALRNLREADPKSPRVLLAEGLAVSQTGQDGRGDTSIQARCEGRRNGRSPAAWDCLQGERGVRGGGTRVPGSGAIKPAKAAKCCSNWVSFC